MTGAGASGQSRSACPSMSTSRKASPDHDEGVAQRPAHRMRSSLSAASRPRTARSMPRQSRWMTTWCTSWTVAVEPASTVMAWQHATANGFGRGPVRADGEQPVLVRRGHRRQHVRAASRRRQRDQHVAGPAVGMDGTAEGVVRPVVVDDRGGRGVLGADGQRGERAPLAVEAADELGGQVLGLGRAAAVADGQQAGLRRPTTRRCARRGPRCAPRRAPGGASASAS